MKILFFGGNLAKKLAQWLEMQNENIVYIEDKIKMEKVREINPDFIVSYNYKYIISKEIIDYVKGNIINLHISYLPYNKGYHPNVWSWLEDTPKGITIHYVDEGVDTGDIIVQRRVHFDEENETLKTTHKILNREIQELFKENWDKIKNKKIIPQLQAKGGSIHFKKDFIKFEPLLKEKGWNTPIRDVREQWSKKSAK